MIVVSFTIETESERAEHDGRRGYASRVYVHAGNDRREVLHTPVYSSEEYAEEEAFTVLADRLRQLLRP